MNWTKASRPAARRSPSAACGSRTRLASVKATRPPGSPTLHHPDRAPSRSRTGGPLLTRQVLCQLSYRGGFVLHAIGQESQPSHASQRKAARRGTTRTACRQSTTAGPLRAQCDHTSRRSSRTRASSRSFDELYHAGCGSRTRLLRFTSAVLSHESVTGVYCMR